MKKLLFTTTLLSSFLTVFSQDNSTKELRGRSSFVSISSGTSSQKDLTVSAEVGTWGLKKATSFSICTDFVRNLDNPNGNFYWVGIKPYFTFYDNGKISYMIYGMPKFKVNDFDLLIENGLSMNYVASNQLLISVGLGFQSGKDYTLTPSVSFGAVFLLQNIYKK